MDSVPPGVVSFGGRGTQPAYGDLAYWALAAGNALDGDIDAANQAFSTSLSLLERNRRWREASEASRAWAQTLRNAGRTQDALDVLERQADYASHLHKRLERGTSVPHEKPTV